PGCRRGGRRSVLGSILARRPTRRDHQLPSRPSDGRGVGGARGRRAAAAGRRPRSVPSNDLVRRPRAGRRSRRAADPGGVAAGGVLIQEAGGLVTDWEGAQGWLDGDILAGSAEVHAALLELAEP